MVQCLWWWTMEFPTKWKKSARERERVGRNAENGKKLNSQIYSHIWGAGKKVCLFALAIDLVMVSIDQISGSRMFRIQLTVADWFFDTCTPSSKRITFDRNRLVFRNRLCYTLHTMVRARRRGHYILSEMAKSPILHVMPLLYVTACASVWANMWACLYMRETGRENICLP